MENKQYLNISENLLGIDIGFNTVKIVEIAKSGKPSLQTFAFAQAPEEAIYSLKKEDIDKTAQSIKIALKSAQIRKISTRVAVSGLPESKVFTKVIQLPQMPESSLEIAVLAASAKHIPLPPNQIYFDWQYIGPASNNLLDVLIVAAPKVLVDNYLRVFQIAGINLIALETKPIAASRALIAQNSQGSILIFDFGAEAIGISIIENRHIRFTYTLPHGSNNLTRVIAQKLKINLNQAEEYKRNIGFIKNDKSPNIYQIVEPVLKDVILEVKHAIDFYEKRSEPQKNITSILTCGGGSLLPGLTAYITEQTKKTANLGNPLINLQSGSYRNFPINHSLRFTTAIGLALRERY